MKVSYERLADRFVQVPLALDGVYRTRLDANQVYRGHSRSPTRHCALIIALQGRATFTFNSTDHYELFPGKALLGGYRMQLDIEVGNAGFEYCLIHYLPRNLKQSGIEPLIEVNELCCPLEPPLMQKIERLQTVTSAANSMSSFAKQTVFYELVNDILQAERQSQNRDSHTFIEETITYIHANYASPLTLSLLAGRYDMKPKYFSYLFQKFAGAGPIDYLIQYRMNKAYELLMTGQFTIKNVAQSVGYADAYYFSRLFKKYKGVSPSRLSGQETK